MAGQMGGRAEKDNTRRHPAWRGAPKGRFGTGKACPRGGALPSEGSEFRLPPPEFF
jgi:hypothetical protein